MQVLKDKEDKQNEYFTGQKSKELLVHVMQDHIEVTKPIKTKIYAQDVEWNKRKWHIYPPRFVYDHKGIAHQYVDVNDVAVLSFNKDHTDSCKKCGKRMTVDAKQARELGKKGVFHAIWGIDSTHMILLIMFAIGAMVAVGAFFWAFTNDTKHTAQLEAEKIKTSNLSSELSLYKQFYGNSPPVVNNQ
jgi:hypothetical protein